jgi:hypothetical protein
VCHSGLTTPLSRPASITRRHVSVSQEPSSGRYVVARKRFHCWHTDHVKRIELFTLRQNQICLLRSNLKISKLKIKVSCDVAPCFLISLCSFLMVCASVPPGTHNLGSCACASNPEQTCV